MTKPEAIELTNKIEELCEALMAYKGSRSVEDSIQVRLIKDELVSLMLAGFSNSIVH